MLVALRYFPRKELDTMLERRLEPEQVIADFETVDAIPSQEVQNKILLLPDIITLAQQQRSMGGRIGLALGKWRLGPHEEHEELLRKARLVLGRYGMLIAGVESQEAIKKRRGEDHFSLSDQYRAELMAEFEPVTAVFVASPTQEDMKDQESTERYYQTIWSLINPDLYVYGSKNYQWRDTFAQRGRKLGVLNCWSRPDSTISTTDILNRLRGLLGT